MPAVIKKETTERFVRFESKRFFKLEKKIIMTLQHVEEPKIFKLQLNKEDLEQEENLQGFHLKRSFNDLFDHKKSQKLGQPLPFKIVNNSPNSELAKKLKDNQESFHVFVKDLEKTIAEEKTLDRYLNCSIKTDEKFWKPEKIYLFNSKLKETKMDSKKPFFPEFDEKNCIINENPEKLNNYIWNWENTGKVIKKPEKLENSSEIDAEPGKTSIFPWKNKPIIEIESISENHDQNEPSLSKEELYIIEAISEDDSQKNSESLTFTDLQLSVISSTSSVRSISILNNIPQSQSSYSSWAKPIISIETLNSCENSLMLLESRIEDSLICKEGLNLEEISNDTSENEDSSYLSHSNWIVC